MSWGFAGQPQAGGAAGSEAGSCQVAPSQVVHGSDPAARGHWAAPGCGDGGAGFAFYVQSVHFLLDNKTLFL